MSEAKTKSRSLGNSTVRATTTRTLPSIGFTTTDNSVPVSSFGRQVTTSEGHPYQLLGEVGFDIGGDFTTRRIQVESKLSNQSWTVVDGAWLCQYNGHFLAAQPPRVTSFSDVATEFPDLSSSDASLMALGTKAIALCKPTKDVVSLPVMIGELLREGLPSATGLTAWKQRRDLSQGTSGEFLNFQFGIAPLLNDLKGFHTALTKSKEIIDQFERDSGRLVRRGYTFPTERTEEVLREDVTGPFPAMASLFYNQSTGLRRTSRTIKRKRWFSGAFTYHLPQDGSWGNWKRKVLEAEKLFGLVPDVEDLWNLTPWSWATDWVFNTGDVISNIADWTQYGLVMPYGYMMEETSVTYTTTHTIRSQGGSRGAEPLIVTDVTKKRRGASPFGFGVTWDGFSSTQVAILAALGISRYRK